VDGEPATLSDPDAGTLLYLVETRDPCECGERRVMVGLQGFYPTIE